MKNPRTITTPSGRQKTIHLEADVKAEIKKLLDHHGWFWWMPPANGYGKRTVDFMALKNGVFVAIEAKRGKPKPTVLQIGFLNSVRAENGFGFVVNEDRLIWLDAFLAAFARATVATAQEQDPSTEDGATMLNAIRELTLEL